MPDLTFRVDGAEPRRGAVEPTLAFRLHVSEALKPGSGPAAIHSVLLRCQVRVEPARRRYTPEEQERLHDLFDTPERWGKTLRPFLWTQLTVVVPPFTTATDFDVPVPCSYDFSLAATKYFDALEEGELPLGFLFSGTIFYEGPGGGLQVAQVSWEKEASYRLLAATWRSLMNSYYPNSVWLRLRKDVFDMLSRYRASQALPTNEAALERLLAGSRETREGGAP